MFYGLTTEQELMHHIRRACEIVNPRNVPESIHLLQEVACAESDFGHARDRHRAQGKGAFQFDWVGWKDTTNRMYAYNRQVCDQIEDDTGISLRDLSFDQLEYAPLAGAILCRCKFYLLPDAIPKDLHSRARMWKAYYNSNAGAGTPEKYVAAAKRRFGQQYA